MDKSLENVVVKAYSDIVRALTPYLANGNARELLLRGFDELAKAHKVYRTVSEELVSMSDEMGGYLPAKPVDPLLGRHWVDDIVTRRLGGARAGLVVRWSLADGTYEWEPVNKELKKC